MEKWKSVFDAHPDVSVIFIGTNEKGEEQPFLNKELALNFANGKAEKVTALNRPTAKADAKPKAEG